MPFARPATSPSGSSSYASPHNGSALNPAKLATPWDASSLEKQLETMKQEAAASSASSLSSSPARSFPSALPRSQPSPNISNIAIPPSSQDATSPDSQAMSSNSSSSSPPEQYFTSRRALKQRLFQMSDDDEDALSAVATPTAADGSSSGYNSRFRADRRDPIRQSISALSGVTVIGRGSISSKRDSQGSISTIGSHRNSLEDSRPGAMYRTQSDNVTAPLSTESKREVQEPTPTHASNGLDMGSALHLLHMYPRAASPPRNFDDGPMQQPTQNQQKSRSRSISPHSIAAHDQGSGGQSEGGSRPVRRHSRSSMASDLLMSPVMGNLTMTAPNTARDSDHSTMASPLDVFVFNNRAEQPEANTSSITFPISPASLPEASSSRTLPSVDGDSPQSRRTISSSRSVSTNDLAQIMRSFSSRSRRATGRRRSTQGQPIDEAGPSVPTTSFPTSSSAEPLRRSRRGTRQPSTGAADLKDLIRQKRRMASAPFHTSASVHTSGTTSPIMASGAQSPVATAPQEAPAWDAAAQRRARSRRSSAASTGFNLNFTSNGFEEARMRALRGMGDVVMTPSVEEWKLLGLDESLNDRNGSESSGSESDDSSSESSNAVGEDSDELPGRLRKVSKKSAESASTDSTYRPRMGSITAFNQYYGSAPPASKEPSPETPVRRLSGRDSASSVPVLSRSSSRTLGLSPKKKSRALRESDTEHENSSAIDDDSNSDMEAVPMSSKSALPTLSRQSLSMPAGAHIPGLGAVRESESPVVFDVQAPRAIRALQNGNTHDSLPGSPAPVFSPSRASSPIPLTLGGPTDPRAYSAVTGLRNIDSFVVQGEAGKGAYGLVRKVREKGADGRPFGPNLMLKYIVKQRILADAYKRHKVLGVIPMEIHVLDFIRRIYRGPGHPSRDPVSQLKKMHGIPPPTAPATAEQAANQSLYGHPNLCQMLDFFEDTENYYLVMSCFGNGQDLFDYVDAAPMGLTITESKSFLTQIVDAVAFLHSHGVVHRDIKDENIILDGKGGVQLIDFGSAAYIKEGKPYFDTFSGTLDFASPEVLRGERYGGKETDIWALGVLAYVILCGECPFWSSEESLAGLYAGCRSEAALQAKADSPEVQAELHGYGSGSDIDAQDAVDFVHQCLQVHARDRPPAVQLRKHRFICGKTGWIGKRGWEGLDGYNSATSGFDSA